jgi:hypothetical protein
MVTSNDRMRARKRVWILLGLLVLLVLWYLFRPERLFINKRVNEPLPGSGLLLPNRLGLPDMKRGCSVMAQIALR